MNATRVACRLRLTTFYCLSICRIHLGDHPLGVGLEFLPCFLQLRLAGDDELVGWGGVGRVFFDCIDVVQQVVAGVVLSGGKQGLGFAGGFVLGSEPQRGVHAGSEFAVALDGFAGLEFTGEVLILPFSLLLLLAVSLWLARFQFVDGAGDASVQPIIVFVTES